MSRLQQALDDYLTTRRALGFKLREHGTLLAGFVDYLERAGAPTVTVELALAWATLPKNVDPYRWKARLTMVRGFAAYLHTLDPTTEVPPADLLAYRTARPTPRLYSDAEIAAILAAAARLAPRMRAATYHTLFGLLAATGLRVNEAIALTRDDVDLSRGLLTIRQAKFDRTRQLPVHPSTVEVLAAYTELRDELFPHPDHDRFFVSTTGTALRYTGVQKVFVAVAERVGIDPEPVSRRPRLHSLRHTFAVDTLLEWHRAGVDVDARMPLLSAYLGHTHPASTYWYLQAAPELLAVAAQRLELVRGRLP
jgi:integrase/recombinase XerD